MKKPTLKPTKLTLDKQVIRDLRTLTPEHLQQVAGGMHALSRSTGCC